MVSLPVWLSHLVKWHLWNNLLKPSKFILRFFLKLFSRLMKCFSVALSNRRNVCFFPISKPLYVNKKKTITKSRRESWGNLSGEQSRFQNRRTRGGNKDRTSWGRTKSLLLLLFLLLLLKAPALVGQAVWSWFRTSQHPKPGKISGMFSIQK